MPGSDKTEAPTPKRKDEARKKGQVAHSIEIGSVVVLLVSFVIFQSTGADTVQNLGKFMVSTFQPATLAHINETNMSEYASTAINSFLTSILPLSVGLIVASLFVNLAQTKLLFTFSTIKPNLNKINPLSGLKRMFSGRALVELFKSILKIALCGFMAYTVLSEKYTYFMSLQNSSLVTSAGAIGSVAIELGLKIGAILIAIAVIDYMYQRHQIESTIKMSKEEVKEEFRQAEGDPQIKARIKSQQRAFAKRRMMQTVPLADVVITNPTHLAIAIKYDLLKASAPIVTAKGERLMAEQIKKVARESGVPVLENKPLAQAIYKMVDIGEQIPPTLYQAVAEVLAFIYQLKRPNAQPQHA